MMVNEYIRFTWRCKQKEVKILKHIAADNHCFAADVLSSALICYLKNGIKTNPEWKLYLDELQGEVIKK